MVAFCFGKFAQQSELIKFYQFSRFLLHLCFLLVHFLLLILWLFTQSAILIFPKQNISMAMHERPDKRKLKKSGFFIVSKSDTKFETIYTLRQLIVLSLFHYYTTDFFRIYFKLTFSLYRFHHFHKQLSCREIPLN